MRTVSILARISLVKRAGNWPGGTGCWLAVGAGAGAAGVAAGCWAGCQVAKGQLLIVTIVFSKSYSFV